MYGLQVWLTFLGRQRPLVEGKELSGGHFGDSLASICIQPQFVYNQFVYKSEY